MHGVSALQVPLASRFQQPHWMPTHTRQASEQEIESELPAQTLIPLEQLADAPKVGNALSSRKAVAGTMERMMVVGRGWSDAWG